MIYSTFFISLIYTAIATHPWSYVDETTFSCNLADQVLDLVVLADASCPMGHEMCMDQQLQIANTIAAIRGTQQKTLNGQTYPAVRVGFIEFGPVGTTPNILIDLLSDTVNSGTSMTAEESQREIYEKIKNSSICSGNTTTPHRYGQPNLVEAVGAAVNQFDDQNNIRDKKVLIFSNCPIGVAEQNTVCTTYGDVLRGGLSGQDEGHNVIMVNNRLSLNWIELPQIELEVESYIDCLVSHDLNRIFVNNLWEIGSFTNKVLPGLSTEICEVPTPAPTTDPTVDPTSYPTSTPSASPTPSPTDETQSPTTPEPSSSPSSTPSELPTSAPSNIPTAFPTLLPSASPTLTETTSTSTTSTTSSTTQSASNTNTMTTTQTLTGCASHRTEPACNGHTDCQWNNYIESCLNLIHENSQSTTSPDTTQPQTTLAETTESTLTASMSSTQSAVNVTGSSPVAAPKDTPSEPVSVWIYVAIGSAVLCCLGLVAGLAVCCKKATKHEGYGYVATDGGGEYLSENDASRSVNNQAVPAYQDEEAAAPANDQELQGLAQQDY